MPREPGAILDYKDPFPRMEIDATDGNRLALPDYFAGGWGVLLVYRGHW